LRDVSITPPTFGPDDDVIVATSTGAVYAVPPGGAAQPVTLTGRLEGVAVRGLALSRDWTRIAVAAATGAGVELDVATVAEAGGRITLRQPRIVLPAASDVSGVAWAGATEIVSTVSASHSGREIVEISSDGFSVQELSDPSLPGDLTEVAAAPGQHVLAADRAGTWLLAGRRWRRVSGATAPSYAGS
jgi:hypothetical protein